MEALFLILGAFGFSVGGFMLIILHIRKKPKKKWGFITAGAFTLIIFGAAISPTVEEAEKKENETVETAGGVVKTEQPTAQEKAFLEELEAEQKKIDEEAEKKAAEKAAAKAKEKEAFDSLAPKSKVEKIIVDELKSKTNTDKDRIVSVELLPEEDESLYFLITLNADENLTPELIRHGMLTNSKKIIEPISKIENMNKIVLRWHLPLVDSYGNSKDTEVLTINLEKDALDKINWDNFLVEKFPDVANTYFEHPAIKK